VNRKEKHKNKKHEKIITLAIAGVVLQSCTTSGYFETAPIAEMKFEVTTSFNSIIITAGW
jgi:hypothetical protein